MPLTLDVLAERAAKVVPIMNYPGTYDNILVTAWLEQARAEHNQELQWSELEYSSPHWSAIVLLVRIYFAEAEIVRSAYRQAQAGGGSSTDGYKQHVAWLKVIEVARASYDALISKLGMNAAPGILVSSAVRYNYFTESYTPTEVQSAPEKAFISTVSVASSDVTITWRQPQVGDFSAFYIYRHTSATMVDLSTFNDSEHTGYKGMVSGVTKVATITEPWYTAYKDKSLAAGSYYYVVATEDRSGRLVFSAVSSVATVPAP